MFGPQQYVPVLKCKQAEKAALAGLPSATRRGLTPILEIVELSKKPLPDHLATAVKDLFRAVGSGSCFIDTRELAPHGPPAAHSAFAAVQAAGVPFVPVTGPTRTEDVAAALAYRSAGVCLRVTKDDFEGGHLPTTLSAFLVTHQLRPDEVDLVMDLGEIDNMVASGVLRLARAFLSKIPFKTDWRTFTLVGSAFPKTMGVVPRKGDLLVDRVFWDGWKLLHGLRSQLSRLPCFGDFAIQHPVGVEGYDPRLMPMSAAIRYATGNEWLLIKGESTRKVRPSIQYRDLSSKLVQSRLSSHFRGAGHCPGCDMILAAPTANKGYGSATKWREIGTSHHVTTVVEQLAGLTWP